MSARHPPSSQGTLLHCSSSLPNLAAVRAARRAEPRAGPRLPLALPQLRGVA